MRDFLFNIYCMKYIKLYEFFNFKKKFDIKPFEDTNNRILKMIYDLGMIGDFNPTSWLRKGDILPNENRNDEVITNFNGISLSYDIVTKDFEISIPVKFKSSFKYEILSLIENKFDFISKKDTGYTMVIRFK